MFLMYKTFKEDINTPPFYGNLKYKIIIPKEESNTVFVTTEQATKIFGAKKLNKMLKNHKQEIDLSKYTIGIDPYDKQETLEEVELTKFALSEAKKWVGEDDHHKIATYATAISVGAKWQQERSYSEEEVRKAIQLARLCTLDSNTGEFVDLSGLTEVCTYGLKETHSEDSIIEQFKKK